ncbi:hypothetical protein B6U91_00410 [Candidatus Pacearchaeota archaeon ex4484_71]|nr:MAG: hypothetical protein B6U91_00410 [Candidatus Pacearchaeota archaeon ex4484_71]
MVNILQKPILTDFLYPFLLIFFIVFAVLEKTNLLGSDKKQLNALISLIIGLIFVSAVFPKIVVGNLILFLSVGLVIVFIGLLLWGFVNKGEIAVDGKFKTFLVAIIIISVVFALIWATGFGGGIANLFTNLFNFLFNSSWSANVWTNFIVVVLIIGAIGIVLKYSVSGSSS